MDLSAEQKKHLFRVQNVGQSPGTGSLDQVPSRKTTAAKLPTSLI